MKIYLKAYGLICDGDDTFWQYELGRRLELWNKPHPKSYTIELEWEILEFIQEHLKEIYVKDHSLPPHRPYIPTTPDGAIDDNLFRELLSSVPRNLRPSKEELDKIGKFEDKLSLNNIASAARKCEIVKKNQKKIFEEHLLED